MKLSLVLEVLAPPEESDDLPQPTKNKPTRENRMGNNLRMRAKGQKRHQNEKLARLRPPFALIT
jgi:hypothetical protein